MVINLIMKLKGYPFSIAYLASQTLVYLEESHIRQLLMRTIEKEILRWKCERKAIALKFVHIFGDTDTADYRRYLCCDP